MKGGREREEREREKRERKERERDEREREREREEREREERERERTVAKWPRSCCCCSKLPPWPAVNAFDICCMKLILF